MLRKWEESLRSIYAVYSGHKGAILVAESLLSNKLMDFSEWAKLLKDLNMYDAVFTPREGTLAFIWSRMKVIEEQSKASRRKLLHLSFEDFLEAIVRLSTMKALPLRRRVCCDSTLAV